MDASSYLRKQGWRGHGHSLDHTDRGIKKPLLVSKKVDVLGVGLNKHKAVSDQWWLRAFDQGLKSLGTGQETALASVQKHGHNRGGLYGRFVKGERLPGSIENSTEPSDKSGSSGSSTPSGVQSQEVGSRIHKLSSSSELAEVAGDRSESSLSNYNMAIEPPQTNSTEALNGQGKKRKREDKYTEKRAGHKAKQEAKREAKELGVKWDRRLYANATGHQPNRVAPQPVVEEGKTSGVDIPVSNGVAKSISPEKLAEYAKRAELKGVSLEDYIKRREEKYAAKQASRLDSTSMQAKLDDVKGDTAATKRSRRPKTFSFVVDTVGEAPETDVGQAARQAISEGRAITLFDKKGKETFKWKPDTPVPVDLRLWEGVKANTLPRPICKARLEWMKQRRELRKTKSAVNAKPGRQTPKKSKGQRKIEEREELVKEILVASRKALVTGTKPESFAANGIENVPLVNVSSKNGPFSKGEMALARSVGRSALKRAKQDTKKDKKERGPRKLKKKSVKPFVRKSSTRHLQKSKSE